MRPIGRAVRMRSHLPSCRPAAAPSWKHPLYPSLPRCFAATPVLGLVHHGSTLAPRHDHDLFKYTSGRYLYNEHLSLLNVEFSVEALKRVTARAVGCDSFETQQVQKKDAVGDGNVPR
ncbi:hypothetical protein TEQG_01804 [Trichophyton equinum CBS 127.97]|uniref:Uncharacterized protein n=1 Tax=Trichophyton equinum (strain ATCC MYA-4606 / CBS 127.97) TaxID=559882 RepID=F2PLJ9_TRIEC|nr:hypothetical protein TEQG_01804 [Trichophyton equinum CBS 127.97]